VAESDSTSADPLFVAHPPSISVLIPTLNAQRTIGACLASIREQRYKQDRIEIVIADGGSNDNTLRIASGYNVRVIANPLRTGETGKAVALSCARNDLVCLLDSDNILMRRDWFERMVVPFRTPDVVGSEPIEFVSEPCDTLVDRYCAAMGVNDPLCLFIGNYDRRSALTGRWTSLPIKTENTNGDIYFRLAQPWLPTIGANGTMYRRSVIAPLVSQELIDVDLPYKLRTLNANALFVKVDVGLRHLYCRDVETFVRKQRRRIRDYFEGQALDRTRMYPWASEGRAGAVKFCLYSFLVVPLLWQTGVAFLRSRRKAVFFHPIACYLTLVTYALNYLFARGKPLSRDRWSQ